MSNAKLSWEVNKTSLILTVTDGPKTSTYTLRKSASGEAHSAILRAVQGDLGTTLPGPPPEALRDLPVHLPGAVPDGPSRAIEEILLEAEIHDEIPQTEEQSLEELKHKAWEWAQKNVLFQEGVIRDDTASALLRQPEYREHGRNPGFPELEQSGFQTVDGKFMTAADVREKPKFNLDNHED